MSLKFRLASLAAFAVLATGLVSACSSSDDEDETTVKIGALLPLTGALASYGETSEAALNDLLKTLNKDSDAVELVIEDTKTDSATALSLLEDMHEDGISIVVGPFSSSEVTAVKQFADQNGMLLLSLLSTATSLAVPDNIYRFTPDDNFEGAAAAALAYADGVRTVIAVNRDDPGNQGLQDSFKTSFERLGGKVVPGLKYGADETNFDDEVQTIVNAINSNAGPEGELAVYLTAFAEVTSLFEAIVDKGGNVPGSVIWYGSDSVALSKELVASAKASQFAASVRYPNPILGLRDADKAQWEPVNNRLAEELGRTPDAFALAAYDALNTAFQVMTNAGDRDLAGKKAELVSITNSATGLTGPLRLNEAGDRAIGIYDFWSVCQKNGAWTWYRSATYDPTGGAKQLGPC